MNNLRDYSEEKLVQLVQEGWITAKDFTDSGICPTCFDREHDYILFGNSDSRLLYENEDFICLLVDRPRANGHTVIISKKHFKDMSETDDEVISKVYLFAKKVMIALKETYECESVYLCTMCDGPMNHFHVQLIPRYKNEKRGSKNFVKYRRPYHEDLKKVEFLREVLKGNN